MRTLCIISVFSTEYGTIFDVALDVFCSESTITEQTFLFWRAIMDIVETIKTLDDKQCEYVIAALNELLREESVQSEQCFQAEPAQSI